VVGESVGGVANVLVSWDDVLPQLFMVAKCCWGWILGKEGCTTAAAYGAMLSWSSSFITLSL